MLQAILFLPHVREVQEYAEMVRLWRGQAERGYSWGYVDHSVPEWYETSLSGWQKLHVLEGLKRGAPPTTDYDDAAKVATAMTSFVYTALERGEQWDNIMDRLTVIRASHRWRRDDYDWWVRFYQLCYASYGLYVSRNQKNAPDVIKKTIAVCTAKDQVPKPGVADFLVNMVDTCAQHGHLPQPAKFSARCYAAIEPDRAAFRILPSRGLVEEYAELVESWCTSTLDTQNSRERRAYTMKAWEEATAEAAARERVDWRRVRDAEGYEPGEYGYVADTMAVALKGQVELCDSLEDMYHHIRYAKVAHTRRQGDESWWRLFVTGLLGIWAEKSTGDRTALKPPPGFEKVLGNEGAASEAVRNSSVVNRSVVGNMRETSDNSNAVSKLPGTEPRDELEPARKRAAVINSALEENLAKLTLVEAKQKEKEEEEKAQFKMRREELLRLRPQDIVRSQQGQIRATPQKPGAREKPKETGSDMEGLILTITDAKEGSHMITGTISDEATRPVLVEGQSARGEDKVTLNVTGAVLERLGDQQGEEIRKLQQEKDALTKMTRTTTVEDGHPGPSSGLDLLQRKRREVTEGKRRESLELQQKEEDWNALLQAQQEAEYQARCAQRPQEKGKGLADDANRGLGERDLFKRPLATREKQHVHHEEPHGEEEAFKDALEQLPEEKPKVLSDIEGSHASDRDTRLPSDDWIPFTPTMEAEWEMCREEAAAVAKKVGAEIEARRTTPDWDEIDKELTGDFDAESMEERLRSRIGTYPPDMSERLRSIFSNCLALELSYIYMRRRLEETSLAGGHKKGLLSVSRVSVDKLISDRLTDSETTNLGGSGLGQNEPSSTQGSTVRGSSDGPGVDNKESSGTQPSAVKGSSEGAQADKTLPQGSGVDMKEPNHPHGSFAQRFFDGLQVDQTSTGEPTTSGLCKASSQPRSRNSPEIVSRFLSKGDSRYRPQCPDAHILPDGRLISYDKSGRTISGVPFTHAPPITRHDQVSSTTTGPFKAPVPTTPPSSAAPSDDDEDFSACVPGYKCVGACPHMTPDRDPVRSLPSPPSRYPTSF